LERSTYTAARNARSAISGQSAMRSVRVPGSMTRIATTIYERHAGRRYVMVLRMSKGCLVDGR